MSGIGVITNPTSRRNRRDPGVARALSYVLGERGELAAPCDLDALAATLRHFRDREIDVLCVNGGDGTVHQAVTAMVRAYQDGPALPALVVLRGGTMNIIADSVGVSVSPERMLTQVVDAFHSGEALPERTVRLMEVEIDGAPPRYGFLAGNGVIAGFLQVYYERDHPTPVDAATLLARAAASALTGGPLVKRILRPWRGTVTVDGQAWDGREWVAIALGTVEEMGFGFRVFHEVADNPDKVQVVGIGSSVARLATELPRLYAGRGTRDPANRCALSRELILQGDQRFPIMIDGDLYEATEGRVRARSGPAVRLLLPR